MVMGTDASLRWVATGGAGGGRAGDTATCVCASANREVEPAVVAIPVPIIVAVEVEVLLIGCMALCIFCPLQIPLRSSSGGLGEDTFFKAYVATEVVSGKDQSDEGSSKP